MLLLAPKNWCLIYIDKTVRGREVFPASYCFNFYPSFGGVPVKEV